MLEAQKQHTPQLYFCWNDALFFNAINFIQNVKHNDPVRWSTSSRRICNQEPRRREFHHIDENKIVVSSVPRSWNPLHVYNRCNFAARRETESICVRCLLLSIRSFVDFVLILLWDPKLPPFWTGFGSFPSQNDAVGKEKESPFWGFIQQPHLFQHPSNKKMEKSIRKNKKNNTPKNLIIV